MSSYTHHKSAHRRYAASSRRFRHKCHAIIAAISNNANDHHGQPTSAPDSITSDSACVRSPLIARPAPPPYSPFSRALSARAKPAGVGLAVGLDLYPPPPALISPRPAS